MAARTGEHLGKQRYNINAHGPVHPPAIRCLSPFFLKPDDHFSASGVSPAVRLEMGSNEAIKQLVAGGMGLAVISRHALGPHLEDEQLTELDVAGFPIHSSWSIIYPRGKRLSPIAGEFLRFLEGGAEEMRRRFRA